MRKQLNKSKTVSGGVLLFAVFLTTVMLIITSSIIVLTSISRRQNEHVIQKQISRITIMNAVQFAMAEPDMFTNGQNREINIFPENEFYKVTVLRQEWGLYEVISAKTNNPNDSQALTVLTNRYWQTDGLPVLWVNPSQFKLKVSGNTQIVGKVRIPGAKFEKASIAKKSFCGVLPNSTSIENSAVLPNLAEKLNAMTFENLSLIIPQNTVLDKNPNQDGYNSFCKQTKLTYLETSSLIENGNISGNRIVICNGLLKISKAVKITDAILIARSIEFESGFNGSLQAFAYDSIHVNENCKFASPSSFIILRNHNIEQSPHITLMTNVEFNGAICCWALSPTVRNHCRIQINENTSVYGSVFCNGYSEVNGTIKGHLITRSTMVNISGGMHENNLIDSKILENKTNIPAEVNLFNDTKKLKIIKLVK